MLENKMFLHLRWRTVSTTAARQRKPIEGRMYRKQNFRSYSRNLHEFALNIISVPSYRQEGCLNVTQKATIFSSSRCWQEKGLGFCCGFGFFLSLFQLSRSPLCPNRKLHGEVAALHTEKACKWSTSTCTEYPQTISLADQRLAVMWPAPQPPFYILWRTENFGFVAEPDNRLC